MLDRSTKACYPSRMTNPTEPRSIYPRHFFQGPSVPRRKTGFIVMPFATKFDPVHEAARAGIQGAGLEPVRSDDMYTPKAVLEKILRQIAEAEVVVADLTGRNANVFYELGIAHMVKDNVILLAQSSKSIPFDLRPFGCIIYRSTESGLRELAENLKGAVQELSRETGPKPPVRVHFFR